MCSLNVSNHTSDQRKLCICKVSAPCFDPTPKLVLECSGKVAIGHMSIRNVYVCVLVFNCLCSSIQKVSKWLDYRTQYNSVLWSNTSLLWLLSLNRKMACHSQS